MEKKTIEERVLAMRARVKEKTRERDEAQARVKRQEEQVQKGRNTLLDALRALYGLPVKPYGTTSVDWDVKPSSAGRVEQVYIKRGNQSQSFMMIEFIVKSDPEGTCYIITHDDDEITLDIALDLATTVVEGVLDA